MLSRIADILQVSCDELHNPEKTLEKKMRNQNLNPKRKTMDEL